MKLINHTGTKHIETRRLILRKFRPEDADGMFNNWASDEEVTKYLTWPTHKDIEITRNIVALWSDMYVNKEYYQWVIEIKDIGMIIGSISLVNVDNHNENCEIGYCLGRDYWNKGYATEAFKAVIEFLFTEVGFERITGRHDVENAASGRVMVKSGLKYEGTLRKISKNSKGILVDCKYYSILKDEYFKKLRELQS